LQLSPGKADVRVYNVRVCSAGTRENRRLFIDGRLLKERKSSRTTCDGMAADGSCDEKSRSTGAEFSSNRSRRERRMGRARYFIHAPVPGTASFLFSRNDFAVNPLYRISKFRYTRGPRARVIKYRRARL